MGRNRFMSFCIRFEKSHKNLLSGSLYKVSIKLEIKSGNRTFYKYYRNDYRNVYVFLILVLGYLYQFVRRTVDTDPY